MPRLLGRCAGGAPISMAVNLPWMAGTLALKVCTRWQCWECELRAVLTLQCHLEFAAGPL